MLISLERAGKLYADRVIFLDVSLKVEEQDRIGVVGANGAGKTTLLHVLSGELSCDEGERAALSGLRIGFLKQNSGLSVENSIYQEMRSVFASLLETQRRMKSLSAQMAIFLDHNDPEYQALAADYAQSESFFSANDGYTMDVRIETVLNGMGFREYDRQTQCSTLSGGEKTRLALAKLLLSDPDVLILDEPTNHLDFETLEWLEEYLQGYKGALLVVSHDRYFLDRICTKIWDFEALHVRAYKGNYTKFIQTRSMIYERQQKDYEMYQQNVVKLTDYIARNKARASTAGMAKSKEKQLDRMEEVKRPPLLPIQARMVFRFEQDPVKDVLQVEDLTLRAGGTAAGRELCREISFSMQKGEKIALVGKNGVGKSTLLKTLLSQLRQEKGTIHWGRNVKIAYYEQETNDLTAYKTVVQEIWDRYPQTYEQDIRNVLGMLRFTGESIYKRIDQLSGGEKARVKFAVMMYEGGNVLLLDEPTNHLDLPTKEALDKALMEYEGTILMVSHDRYLLSRMPSRIIEMHPDHLESYEGGYEQYLKKRRVITQELPKASKTPQTENPYYRGKKQRAQEVAQKRRLVELEMEVAELEQAQTGLQQQMIDPTVVGDYQKLSDCCAQLEQLRQTLSERLEEWAELAEE